MAPKTKTTKEKKEVKVDTPQNNVRAVTQEDLDNNPDWVGNVNVGDVVDFSEVTTENPVNSAPAEVVSATPPKKASKPSDFSGFAIVSGDEFIRIYEDKDNADMFVAKDSTKRAIVDAALITKLTVEFDVLNPKTGVISQTREVFTKDKNGEDWIADAIVFKNANRGTCKYK